MTPAQVVAHFDARFAEIGTKERAVGAKAYMKSALKFHGVTNPQMRIECNAFCKTERLDRRSLIANVDALFATAAFDLRTVAIEMATKKWKLLVADDLAWLVELGRTGACWAHVDGLVMGVIGPVLEGVDDIATPIRAWAADEDFWVRRIALLAQLGSLNRGEGDFELFLEIAVPMLVEKQFFIRKAIGWQLREVSKKRPKLVRDFVKTHGDAASGVTLREAKKYL